MAIGHDHRMARDRATRDEDDQPPGIGRLGTRLLEWAENVVYAGIATFLVATAFRLSRAGGEDDVGAHHGLLRAADPRSPRHPAARLTVVELLFAVRSTVQKRELLAEPFLLVGIIASIKEIVVLSVESAKEVGNGAEFDDRITEIAVLGVLILLLGLTSWLLRRKEREPDEGESGAPAPERQVN